ncbi:hypothetical protein HDU99_000200 [Rhizoclosmatium hyalinum]|nr:hypothetical protein HDU99_000200 [Rhizoclosmatium hyalinum]
MPLSRLQFAMCIAALLVAMIMSSLDNTIVSTALRSIILELHQQELAPWIGSAYMITSASTAALYGRFADTFGRKSVFIFALIVFEIGSLICGMASSMEMLILGRAIAGVGGGGLNSLVLIIISDIVSIRNRGKFQSIVGAAIGISSICGPLAGGAFSDHWSWRWCFYVNIPLGVFTVLVIALIRFNVVEGNVKDKLRRIDYIGSFTLLASVTSFVTPLVSGGTIWAWNSAPVLVLFPLSAVFFAAFVYNEIKIAKDPIVPAAMFVNSNVAALLGIALSLGCIFFSSSYYISLFFQIVFNNTATEGGVASIPMIMGMVITTLVSGVLVSKTGKYRLYFFMGPAILAVGVGLTSLLNGRSGMAERIIFLALMGFGAGFVFQMRVVALQASVPTKYIAVVTALASTCLLLGGAVGIAVTGTIFNNLIASATADNEQLQLLVGILQKEGYPASTSEVLGLLEMFAGMAKKYPKFIVAVAESSAELVSAFNDAFKVAYLSMIVYPVIMLACAFFVKQIDPPKSDGASTSIVAEA